MNNFGDNLLPNLPERIVECFQNTDPISVALKIANSEQARLAEILGAGIPNRGLIIRALDAASIKETDLATFETPVLVAFKVCLEKVNSEELLNTTILKLFFITDYFSEITVAMAAAIRLSRKTDLVGSLGNLDDVDKVSSAMSAARNDVRRAEALGTGVPACIIEFTRALFELSEKAEVSPSKSAKTVKPSRKKARIKKTEKIEVEGEGEVFAFETTLEVDGHKAKVSTRNSFKLLMRIWEDGFQKHLN